MHYLVGEIKNFQASKDNTKTIERQSKWFNRSRPADAGWCGGAC